jgi:hypothetical protein
MAAIATNVVLLAGTTAPSALFIVYRSDWKLTTADLGVVFTVYIGTLVPALLLLGGLADRIGRRAAIAIGLAFALAGLTTAFLAHDRAHLIVARLLQGIGVGVSIGAVAAALAESHRGRIPASVLTGAASNAGLLSGALITASAYDLGAGLNGSYLPVLAITAGCVALLGLFRGKTAPSRAAHDIEVPFDTGTVIRTLAFSLPSVFVTLASSSLYIAMVPAFLENRLHARDPLIGALVISALQAASIAGTFRGRSFEPQRATIRGTAGVVAGLVLLIAGTSLQGSIAWVLVALATVVVGVSGGIAFASAFALAGGVARGQRARVFSFVFVATYLGFGLPGFAAGVIGARTSLTAGFIITVAFLAAITALLPVLRIHLRSSPSM